MSKGYDRWWCGYRWLQEVKKKEEEDGKELEKRGF